MGKGRAGKIANQGIQNSAQIAKLTARQTANESERAQRNLFLTSVPFPPPRKSRQSQRVRARWRSPSRRNSKLVVELESAKGGWGRGQFGNWARQNYTDEPCEVGF